MWVTLQFSFGFKFIEFIYLFIYFNFFNKQGSVQLRFQKEKKRKNLKVVHAREIKIEDDWMKYHIGF